MLKKILNSSPLLGFKITPKARVSNKMNIIPNIIAISPKYILWNELSNNISPSWSDPITFVAAAWVT